MAKRKKEVEVSCTNCGLTYSVLTRVDSAEVAFCPFCGEEVNGDESFGDDEFYVSNKYDDWSDDED